MQGRGSSDDVGQTWCVTRVPTLPGEEILTDVAAGERSVWALYQQLKLELCTVLRRLQATRDRCQVLEQVLAETPELPMVRYLDEKIQQYMAGESAVDEGNRLIAGAMGDQLMQETAEDMGNLE